MARNEYERAYERDLAMRDRITPIDEEADRATRVARELNTVEAHRYARTMHRRASANHAEAQQRAETDRARDWHRAQVSAHEDRGDAHATMVSRLKQAARTPPAPSTGVASLAPGGPVSRGASGPGEASSSDS